MSRGRQLPGLPCPRRCHTKMPQRSHPHSHRHSHPLLCPPRYQIRLRPGCFRSSRQRRCSNRWLSRGRQKPALLGAGRRHNRAPRRSHRRSRRHSHPRPYPLQCQVGRGSGYPPPSRQRRSQARQPRRDRQLPARLHSRCYHSPGLRRSHRRSRRRSHPRLYEPRRQRQRRPGCSLPSS